MCETDVDDVADLLPLPIFFPRWDIQGIPRSSLETDS